MGHVGTLCDRWHWRHGGIGVGGGGMIHAHYGNTATRRYTRYTPYTTTQRHGDTPQQLTPVRLYVSTTSQRGSYVRSVVWWASNCTYPSLQNKHTECLSVDGSTDGSRVVYPPRQGRQEDQCRLRRVAAGSGEHRRRGNGRGRVDTSCVRLMNMDSMCWSGTGIALGRELGDEVGSSRSCPGRMCIP